MPQFNNQLGAVEQLVQGQNVTIHQYGDASRPPARPTAAWAKVPLHEMIERKASLKELADALARGHRRIALVHLPGVGKTTLAALVASEVLADRFPDGDLWAHLGPQADVRQQIIGWATQLGIPLGHRPGKDSDLSEWFNVVQQAVGSRRMVLVIDDVWAAKDAETFMRIGPECAHIVTTRRRDVASRLATATVDVPKLGTAQGVELLRSFAPNAVAEEPEAAEELVRSVDGLPLALMLMGRYLRDRTETGSRRRIRDAIDSLQNTKKRFDLTEESGADDSIPLSLARTIETSYRALGQGLAVAGALTGDELRDVMDSLSIMRPDPACFCAEVGELVTGRGSGDLYDALDALRHAGLLDMRPVACGEPLPGREPVYEDRYTLHRTVADYIRMGLAPERARMLHLRAASYYREQLMKLEEEFQRDATGYRGWYRYEDPRWQECSNDWLHHLIHSGEATQAKIALLRAWLDGFWWWGCFLEFDFCKQLLREWDERGLVPELVEVLQQFMRAYPKETEPDRSAAGERWLEVERLLSRMAASALIDDPRFQDDSDARHVRGLIGIFQAEAQRFGKKDSQAARSHYERALGEFTDNKDDWDSTWVMYHLAELLFENGLADEALELCGRAVALGEQEEDPEILSRLHRLLGDICCARGQWPQAGAYYHEAVRQAYLFQIKPEKPDPYTVRFYPDTSLLLAGRLVEQGHRDPENAMALAQALRRTWAPCREASAAQGNEEAALLLQDAKQLAAQLFPPPLDESALADARRVEAYADEVETGLGQLSEWDVGGTETWGCPSGDSALQRGALDTSPRKVLSVPTASSSEGPGSGAQ